MVASSSRRFFTPLLLAVGMLSSSLTVAAEPPSDPEVQTFLDFYTASLGGMYPVVSETYWKAATDVSDLHTATSVGAAQALGGFTGNPYVIEKAKEFMKRRDSLPHIQKAQLEKILLAAAENPGTIPEVVARRLEAEGAQSNTLDGFEFSLPDAAGVSKKVSPNDLVEILKNSKDLAERKRAWEASKNVGPALKEGLVNLRDLRNRVAEEMGYPSFFSLKVADYQMSTTEMMAMMDKMLEDIRPLYQQLHCWTKYQLAKRYGVPKNQVPKRIPAHWLTNRWAQEWPGLVEGTDLDPLFKDKKPEELVKMAESFYTSMGFAPLPASFWEKSDLWDRPADAPHQKNKHASAWHMDLRNDVRSLMSVRSDFEWFTTTHHELGHIYYYMSYSTPEVPLLLREGANRAFHEGIGELISLDVSQQEYLRQIGVLPEKQKIDQIRWLLNDAMYSVVFVPFAAGVMAHFEHDLYEQKLPPGEFNKRWWDYVARYQGVEPPDPRGEEYCDAATKTHINDDPAGYYDYALATVLKFQLHERISKGILNKDPRNASYRGNQQVGAFLKGILAKGGTQNWRDVLREATGEELNGKAMLAYYAPLVDWLKKQNKGCDCSM